MVSKPVVDVNAVLNALETWIKQRPKLDPADYGLGHGQTPDRKQWYEAWRNYRAEVRNIGKDRTRALRALEEARGCTPHNAELLLGAFRAFSGRLQWVVDADVKTGRGTVENPYVPESLTPAGQIGHLTYATGQYFPTEYRKAAACVLETYAADWRQAWAHEHPGTFHYETISDVKEANRSIGNHWFDRSTMRFFNTRIESELIGGKYFITSERMDDSHRKGYSVRMACPDGTVDTVGEFQQYSDRADARQAIRELLKG